MCNRIARNKPLISEINRKKRLQFARQHKDKGVDFWKNVVFIDESKFNLFQSDKQQVRIYRKPNAAYLVKNLNPTVKHGGTNVMVWGAMGYNGVGNIEHVDKIMDQHYYLDILKRNLKESARKLGVEGTFQFYQDNDPKHKAWNVRMWLLYNCPKVIETPPQSPDLNPIEHLWQHLDAAIRRNHQIKTRTQLKNAIMEEWSKIDGDYTKKLVESMPNRLIEVINRNGYPTRY